MSTNMQNIIDIFTTQGSNIKVINTGYYRNPLQTYTHTSCISNSYSIYHVAITTMVTRYLIFRT